VREIRASSNLRSVRVDFSGAIVNGLLAIVGYVVMFLGVYKVFQIATDIREIKDLMVSGRRSPLGAPPFTAVSAPGLSPDMTKDLIAEDSAAAYAEHLLRAVNAESQRTANAPREVR
jgi:hypothetical protein